MKPSVKSLTRQTLIYGTGNIISRLVTFLLLPILTHALSPQDYGIITLVYVFLGFMNIIYQYGLEPAFFRFSSEDSKDKIRSFSTAFWMILGTSIILSAVIIGFKSQISLILLGDIKYHALFSLTAGILLFDALAKIPFALLRLEERASVFMAVKLLNVVITLTLNIWLVVIREAGIIGVFQSVFFAAVATYIAVLLFTFSSLKISFSKKLAEKFIKFGSPFIPAGLAAIAMEMIDRYLLLHLKDATMVGIYSAGYKLGIFMLLITTAFNYAWLPFFLKAGKTTEASSVFAKIFTYFSVVALFTWITISFFIPEIIRITIGGYSLIGPSFYSAETIVPIILLGYIFQGYYLNFLPGIYFEKKTGLIPIITISGAAINIILNLILIPKYGITGAAIATLIGYAAMAGTTFLMSRRLFYIPYEWKKISVLFLSAIGAYVITILLGPTVIIKLIGILFFCSALFVFRVLSKQEIKQVFSIFKKD
ncbi:MAG: oligosaccharide flippase family protein [Candidatus Marinimicrobia bacterium]|nr:oligosaccharide flippase family protein [Candidatus Neomarinimicrobiota bacterium]